MLFCYQCAQNMSDFSLWDLTTPACTQLEVVYWGYTILRKPLVYTVCQYWRIGDYRQVVFLYNGTLLQIDYFDFEAFYNGRGSECVLTQKVQYD